MTNPNQPNTVEIPDLNNIPVMFEAPSFKHYTMGVVRWFVDAGSPARTPMLQTLIRREDGSLLWATVQTFIGTIRPAEAPVGDGIEAVSSPTVESVKRRVRKIIRK